MVIIIVDDMYAQCTRQRYSVAEGLNAVEYGLGLSRKIVWRRARLERQNRRFRRCRVHLVGQVFLHDRDRLDRATRVRSARNRNEAHLRSAPNGRNVPFR